jgi:hypothetical protein
MKLHNLKPQVGAKKQGIRVGRGARRVVVAPRVRVHVAENQFANIIKVATCLFIAVYPSNVVKVSPP